MTELPSARASARGLARWSRGHPWIFRSDVQRLPEAPGICRVLDQRGKCHGVALCSPRSEIQLRLLDRRDTVPDASWWQDRLATCVARRAGIDATAWRLVHGEGDGLPSLVVDRYDRWFVVQLLSAGLETQRELVLDALVNVCRPEGILLRNDVAVRRREKLSEEVQLARGAVPETVEVREGAIRYLAAPWTGQKTGAFLDQRPNRMRSGQLVRPGGTALDCFAYHGSFALHLAASAGHVTAIDSSADALARARENARLNGFDNIDWVEGDVFETLREWERERRRFDMIVVDPPAFAKNRASIPQALRGYKEVNLRAMRLLATGGTLDRPNCARAVASVFFASPVANVVARFETWFGEVGDFVLFKASRGSRFAGEVVHRDLRLVVGDVEGAPEVHA
ncbi:MAG: class I SAM-dependent rRNA methyltransferase, partial [Gemmatimonadales bacterium]